VAQQHLFRGLPQWLARLILVVAAVVVEVMEMPLVLVDQAL